MKVFTKSLFIFIALVSVSFGAEKEITTDTIIFDVVNVLTHFTEEDAKQYLKDRLDVTDEGLCSVVKAYVKERKERKLTSFDESLFWEIFSEKCEITLPEDISQDFKDFIDEEAKIDPEMLRDLISLKIKGYSVCLLSNLDPFFYMSLEKKGFFKHFDHCTISYLEQVSKPNSKIYENFLYKSQKIAEQCILIDSKEKSLQTAESLGFKTVRFNIHEDESEQLKRWLVEAITVGS